MDNTIEIMTTTITDTVTIDSAAIVAEGKTKLTPCAGKAPPMHGAGASNFTGNIQYRVSPVTLSNEWPKVARLIFVLFCASFGTIVNGFFVASFFIEHSLRRLGNVFLACAGLADMIVTTFILSVVAVVLLSGQWDNVEVCNFLYCLGLTSTYCYSLFFTLVAFDSYYKFYRPRYEYEVFVTLHVGIISLMVILFSSLMAAGGVYLKLDYDYCERNTYGNFYFRIATTMLLHVVPAIFTIVCLVTTSSRIKKRARSHGFYRRSQMYERENAMNASNIAAFLFYIIAWIPYLTIVYEFPGTSDNRLYGFCCIGVFRSVVSSFIYGSVHRSFRRSFARLYNYCFFKNSLNNTVTTRHRRTGEYRNPTSDVRVHIMHQAVNTSSPQRRAPPIRESYEL